MAVNGTSRIAPASLWTRPKVQEFIQHVKSDPSSVLVVGRGETLTVRVPTHEGGKSKLSIKVYMTRTFLFLLGIAFKLMRNGVYFIVIAFLVADLIKVLIYAD